MQRLSAQANASGHSRGERVAGLAVAARREEEDQGERASLRSYNRGSYGGRPGDSIGFSVLYQGELMGTWDSQNRDPRRKSPPETEESVG